MRSGDVTRTANKIKFDRVIIATLLLSAWDFFWLLTQENGRDENEKMIISQMTIIKLCAIQTTPTNPLNWIRKSSNSFTGFFDISAESLTTVRVIAIVHHLMFKLIFYFRSITHRAREIGQIETLESNKTNKIKSETFFALLKSSSPTIRYYRDSNRTTMTTDCAQISHIISVNSLLCRTILNSRARNTLFIFWPFTSHILTMTRMNRALAQHTTHFFWQEKKSQRKRIIVEKNSWDV